MERTLTEADVEAIAQRVVQIIGARLIAPEPRRETPPAPPPEKAIPLKPKLAYSLKELAAELGVSKISIYRLGARGLLKPLPYLRTKIYSHEEVEKFLRGRGGERLK